MKPKISKPQYLYDKSGKKTLVVLSIEEYKELLEDLHDLAVMAKRKNEERMSLDDFENGLKADGFL